NCLPASYESITSHAGTRCFYSRQAHSKENAVEGISNHGNGTISHVSTLLQRTYPSHDNCRITYRIVPLTVPFDRSGLHHCQHAVIEVPDHIGGCAPYEITVPGHGVVVSFVTVRGNGMMQTMIGRIHQKRQWHLKDLCHLHLVCFYFNRVSEP